MRCSEVFGFQVEDFHAEKQVRLPTFDFTSLLVQFGASDVYIDWGQRLSTDFGESSPLR